MKETRAVPYETVIGDVMGAMAEVHTVMDAYEFDRTIVNLVQLRASQINKCGFCVKMHLREARENGETSDRLDRVIVWDQVNDFTAREKAALAWTEALTMLSPQMDLGALRAELRRHFTDPEIGVLTGAVAMINLWNRINVSRH